MCIADFFDLNVVRYELTLCNIWKFFTFNYISESVKRAGDKQIQEFH